MTDEQTITEPATPDTDATPAPSEQPGSTEAASVDQLPAWAQKELADARKDAAKYRTTAQQKDAERQQLLDDFAVRLGLKSDEKPDPAALTAKLTAAEQTARDREIQLAVFRAASKNQGNPDALLDSNTFLASVQSLDPASSDFPTQVSDAIKKAVATNPSLRLVQATGSSAADHAGGSGETGPITEQQLNSMTDEQRVKALRAGKLDHLL